MNSFPKNILHRSNKHCIVHKNTLVLCYNIYTLQNDNTLFHHVKISTLSLYAAICKYAFNCVGLHFIDLLRIQNKGGNINIYKV